MQPWTTETVANRFRDAAITANRLPTPKAKGFTHSWPAFKRQPWENLGAENQLTLPPPSEASVERLLDAQRWVINLDEDDRHLIWMRAQKRRWKEICTQLGCSRMTAYRRWQRALTQVCDDLNTKSTTKN